MSMDDLVRLVKNPPIEYRPELRWWLAEGLHTDETLRYEIDTAHRLGLRRHGVPGHGRGRHRPLPLRLGRGGMGPRLADRRRGDDQAEHVGELHLRHELVERQPPDHRRRPPGRRQGAGRGQRGPAGRRVPHAARCRGSTSTAEPATSGTFPGSAARSASRCWSPSSPPASCRRPRPAPSWTSTPSSTSPTRCDDEALDWTAPDDGAWRLFTYWMHGTGQTASPSASVNYTVSYVDPDGAAGGDRLLGLGGAHARAAGADRAEPPRPDVHGLPRAVDVRRRRPVLGPHGGRGVPDPPRLRHHAVAAVPDPRRCR